MDGLRTNRWMPRILAVFVGTLVPFICVPLVGIAAAIPDSHGVLLWALHHGVFNLAYFAWGAIVIAGVGVLPVMLAAMVLLARAYRERPSEVIVACVLGAIVARYVLLPLVYLDPVVPAVALPWWQLGDVAGEAIAIVAVLLLVRPRPPSSRAAL